MSLCGGNQNNREIEFDHVLSFLQTLLCMSAGITALTLVGLLLSYSSGETRVIYELTLTVNGILLIAGSFAFRHLKRKKEKLEQMEDKNCE